MIQFQSRTTDRCHFGFPLPALRLLFFLNEVFGSLFVGLGVLVARAVPRIQSRQLRAELLKTSLSIHRVARGTAMNRQTKAAKARTAKARKTL